MSYRLSLGLENLQCKIEESPQILESLCLDDAFLVCLIAEFRVAVLSDFDEAYDLVVAQADHGVVHAALIKAQPVIMGLAIGPDPESVAINAHSRPLPQPCPHFRSRPHVRQGFGFEIEC